MFILVGQKGGGGVMDIILGKYWIQVKQNFRRPMSNRGAGGAAGRGGAGATAAGNAAEAPVTPGASG